MYRFSDLMGGTDFVEPYYMVQMSDGDLQEMQNYISKLKDMDYVHEKMIHDNPIHSRGTDVYRECEIHHPKDNSVLYKIGKKIFLDVNEKYYEYDLRDIFEFQLIKYYVGGNYNWHCDYGVSPVRGSVRKLSMSIHLTDPKEYEGGELNLINYSNYPIMVNNNLGSIIVFDSKVPHKVWPVTWGTRIALVGWANGPKLR